MSTGQAFLRFLEKWQPVLKDSKFKETGVLTPEEFVAAGEFLVFKCPTWQWAAGEEANRRPYLPADKQFLVTRNVPCYKRVKDMEYNEGDEATMDGDDGDSWLATHSSAKKEDDTIEEIVSSSAASGKSAAQKKQEEEDDDDDDVPDLDDLDLEDNLVEEDDPAALKPTQDDKNDNNILKTRTYDLTITYDKYYQTPRMWLYGYDEHRRPLSHDALYEDISQDHAKKTVTMEPHPHLSVTQASIHPCKHSNVMKRIIDNLTENGKDLRVDQYLLLFLKFVSAIIPTIDYDYTTSMDA